MSLVSFLHRYVFRRIGFLLLAAVLTSLWLQMHWQNQAPEPNQPSDRSAPGQPMGRSK